MLYPLSYRGNGNYCTTKCDSGRSLMCRLGTCASWRKLASYLYLCPQYGYGLQLLNGQADRVSPERRPWRNSDSPSW